MTRAADDHRHGAPHDRGVLASVRVLGDVSIAEPGALIAFAGPRVVQQSRARSCPTTSGARSPTSASATSTRSSRVRRSLRTSECAPEALQVSENDQEAELRRAAGGCPGCGCSRRRLDGRVTRLQEQLQRVHQGTSDEAIWGTVELARHPERPYTLDYVERFVEDWSSCTATVAAPTTAARDRPRPIDGRTDRPRRSPEGPRRQGPPPSPLRDGPPGGIPQGDAAHGARRAASGSRSFRSSTPPARIPASPPSSTAREARSRARRPSCRASRSRRRLHHRRGRLRRRARDRLADRVLMQENAIYSVISPEGAPRSCGAMRARSRRRQRRSSPTPSTVSSWA